jgi:hypothetical protein
MQPGRHQIVHEIVPIGHLMEDVVDEGLLLACPNLPETIGGFHAARGRGSFN